MECYSTLVRWSPTSRRPSAQPPPCRLQVHVSPLPPTRPILCLASKTSVEGRTTAARYVFEHKRCPIQTRWVLHLRDLRRPHQAGRAARRTHPRHENVLPRRPEYAPLWPRLHGPDGSRFQQGRAQAFRALRGHRASGFCHCNQCARSFSNVPQSFYCSC